MLDRYECGEVMPADGTEAHAPEVPRPILTILIVDDSITTRKLEKSILEAQGDPEDVLRGLERKSDAYLVKQRFDQREPPTAIGQLL